MRKTTRYEHEKQLNPDKNEEQLKDHVKYTLFYGFYIELGINLHFSVQIIQKGSDFKELVSRHDEYNRVLDDVIEHVT